MARALVVDDSKMIRNMLNNMLKELGHEVVGLAEDGLIGCEMYREFEPDFVTLDINMPNLDGIGTVNAIIAEYPDAQIIMVSSIDDRAITYDCIGAGAVDFINKPVKIEKLQEKIDFVLE